MSTLGELLKAGSREHTQEGTDGRKGGQKWTSLRGWRAEMRRKVDGVQGGLGSFPSFLSHAPQKEVPVSLTRLNRLMASPLSGLEGNTLDAPHKSLPTSNQLHPWPAYRPPRNPGSQCHVPGTDPGIMANPRLLTQSVLVLSLAYKLKLLGSCVIRKQ